METSRNNLDMDEFERPKLTTGLNVLTILTFIGCALQLIGSLWGFINAKKSYDEKDKIVAQMNSDEMPEFAKNMMGSPEDFVTLVTRSFENRIPIVLLSLVSVFLCFYGALQMRKLKKQGYLIYVIGEVLPFISMALFLGSISFTGMAFYFSAGIAVLFILLYTFQRKNLVY